MSDLSGSVLGSQLAWLGGETTSSARRAPTGASTGPRIGNVAMTSPFLVRRDVTHFPLGDAFVAPRQDPTHAGQSVSDIVAGRSGRVTDRAGLGRRGVRDPTLGTRPLDGPPGGVERVRDRRDCQHEPRD